MGLALLGTGAILVLLYPVSRAATLAVCRRIHTYIAPLLFRLTKTYLGFRVEPSPYDAAALPPQFLVVSNHQSLLDIPLYMCFFPGRITRYVAKAELGRYVPVVAEMLRAEDHCIIPRTGNSRYVMRCLDQFAGNVVARGQVPVIFPEGHRSRDGSLGDFNAAGIRRLLDKAPMPVALCALDGGYKISTLTGILRNMKNGCYRVKLLKIYPPPATKQAQMEVVTEGKALIAAQLAEWREKKPSI
jgi:1-acyl-sn-glycerol-3-phosphate acyltransferase